MAEYLSGVCLPHFAHGHEPIDEGSITRGLHLTPTAVGAGASVFVSGFVMFVSPSYFPGQVSPIVRKKIMIRVILPLVIVLLGLRTHGDEILLKDGRALKGEVLRYADGILTVRTPEGKTINEAISEVQKIDFGDQKREEEKGTQESTRPRNSKVSVRTSSASLGVNTYSTKLGKGNLCVDVNYHTLYVDAESRRGDSVLFLGIYLEIGRDKPRDPRALFGAGGEILRDTEGYFDIGGRAQKIIVAAKNDGILECEPDRTWLYPREPGESDVVVRVADAEIVVPITVVKLPLKIGDSSKEVIEKLGVPDFKRHAGAAFPDSKRIHNIHYRWNGESADHWGYKQFPGAVIVVRGGKVVNVSSTFIKGSWSAY